LRSKIRRQPTLDFRPPKLELTRQYYEKYERISRLLDANREIVDLVHRDIVEADRAGREGGDKKGEDDRFEYSSDTVLRMVLCQVIEDLSLRQLVVRIDDSGFLRRFVRIDDDSMMDSSTFCRLRNAIQPKTWKKINRILAEHAVREEGITGEALRLDTTAVETNIHYPTDSSLLFDTYRVLGRLIEAAREMDPEAVGGGRLHLRRAKRDHLVITRKAAKRGTSSDTLKPLYETSLGRVEGICDWALAVVERLKHGQKTRRYGELESAQAEYLVKQLIHYRALGLRVLDQATRRVLHGEPVPNEEKLFSLFEPHTELLIRGKAGKPVEFGHMIQIQQVEAKFITDYEVFEKKPVEHQLLRPALESHRALFGYDPDQIAADKGYYESMAALHKLQERVGIVSIAKKGKRTTEETEREWDPLFRHGQRFRAGVEGTISFLKRVLGLFRCLTKGWEHFASTVGATVFAHNLVLLARS
jgi:IS5 family transposase